MKWYEQPIFRNIEHIGIVLAILAVLFDTSWRFFVDRPIANEERIERAWETLSRKIPGNSGKMEAISFLREKGISLVGLDLSCGSMGGRWKQKNASCKSRTWLENANFSGTETNRTILNYGDFSGTNLKQANFSYADLWRASFDGSWLHEVDFTGADFRNSSLRSALLSKANFENARFYNTNISGAKFCRFSLKCAQNLDPNKFLLMWFWDDQPPILKSGPYALEASDSNVYVCNSNQRRTYLEDGRTGRPTECVSKRIAIFM